MDVAKINTSPLSTARRDRWGDRCRFPYESPGIWSRGGKFTGKGLQFPPKSYKIWSVDCKRAEYGGKDNAHERIQGKSELCGLRGAPPGGQYRHGAPEAPAHQGRAGHRQDHAGRGHLTGPEQKAHHLEHQVHHQGPGRPVRLRRGPAPLRQPVRRRGGG